MSAADGYRLHRRITVLVHPGDFRAEAVVMLSSGALDPTFERAPVRAAVREAMQDAQRIRARTGLPLDLEEGRRAMGLGPSAWRAKSRAGGDRVVGIWPDGRGCWTVAIRDPSGAWCLVGTNMTQAAADDTAAGHSDHRGLPIARFREDPRGPAPGGEAA